MTEFSEISDFEMDALKETANIGTGHASIALSKLLNQKVNLALPKTNVLSVHQVQEKIMSGNDTMVGIYSKVKEGIEGNIVILLPVLSAHQLIDAMKKTDFDDAKTNFNDEDITVLKKLGSILYSSYLTSLADFFEQKILFQSPSIVSSIGNSIMDFILVQIGEKENVLLITVGFDIENPNVKGDFVLLFTVKSLSPLLEKLKEKMGVA